MASRNRVDLRRSLWICGATDVHNQRHAAFNVRVLRAGGTEVCLFNGGKNQAEIANLRQWLTRRDDHVVLYSLKPPELKELYPLLRDRRNFSIIADDWWQTPYWFMHEAEYILFRKYHGIAVRQGQLKFLNGPPPPLLLNPFSSQISKFLLLCSLLRPAALVVSPLLELLNWWRRRHENADFGRYIFMPFGVDAQDVPMRSEKIQYDFANTSGTFGIWFMRDPYAPSKCSFGNLYHDRRQLVTAIAAFENNPFAFYDCLRETNYYLPWDLYVQKTQQSRFVICSGGLQGAALPKFVEYACLGVPMIGRPVPFEHPWQEEVFIPVDATSMTRKQLKARLHEALDRYPVMREKCLNLRDPLLKRYHYDALLDLAQAQIDGKPIPPEYIRDHSAKLAPGNA